MEIHTGFFRKDNCHTHTQKKTLHTYTHTHICIQTHIYKTDMHARGIYMNTYAHASTYIYMHVYGH
jgi:hypothetical protein